MHTDVNVLVLKHRARCTSERVKRPVGSRIVLFARRPSPDRSIARSRDLLLDLSLGPSDLVARPIGRALDRTLARSVDRSVDRAFDRSFARAIDRSLDRPLHMFARS